MYDKSCDFSPTVLINKRVQCGGVAGENLYESGHVSFFDKVTSYLTTAQIRKFIKFGRFCVRTFRSFPGSILAECNLNKIETMGNQSAVGAISKQCALSQDGRRLNRLLCQRISIAVAIFITERIDYPIV